MSWRAEAPDVTAFSALSSAMGIAVVLLSVGTGAAAQNTARLQAALDQKGYVRACVRGGGTAYINATLTHRSDTAFIVDDATTLKLTNSVNSQIIRNANWNSPVTSVSGISSVADSFPPHSYTTTVTTATAHGLSVGDYALIKGDASEQYVGVHKVIAVPSSTTFQFNRVSTATLTVGTGTMTVAAADKNLILSGGSLDYNGASNGTGGLTSMAVIYNKVGNLLIEKQTGLNATKYMYYLGSVYRYVVRDVNLHTDSDGVHVSGPCRDGIIDSVHGSSGDDFIVYSATNGGGYTAYDLPDTNGEVINLTISNIVSKTAANTVAIYPGQGYLTRNVRIQNIVTGPRCATGVVISTVNGTTAVVEDILINGISGTPSGSQITVGNGADLGSINSLTIKNVWADAYRAGAYINLLDNWTFKHINISDCSFKWDTTSQAGWGVKTAASTVVYLATMRNIVTDTTGGNSFTARLFLGSQIQEMRVCDSALGGAQFAGIWTATSSNFIPLIWADNLRLGNGSTGIYCLLGAGYSYKAIVSRIANHGSFTFGYSLFLLTSAGVTATITARDLNVGVPIIGASPVGTINFTGDRTAPVDITKISRLDGATVYNSNASADNGTDGACGTGMFICVGTATGSWKRMGTTGGAGNQY